MSQAMLARLAARRQVAPMALLFIDLDASAVNDDLYHKVWRHSLLRPSPWRGARMVPYAGRPGEDEFVVPLEGVEAGGMSYGGARKLPMSFASPVASRNAPVLPAIYHQSSCCSKLDGRGAAKRDGGGDVRSAL
ncbi:hypothetical protein DSL92_01765 [Billgrantia gudaonensis]|uniref:Uncharacterized protein n=1 Tax=Billgrantia gudaonensis TaxID=376427 RepID=A0A432JLG5_9GAMM|nr:hypothetical protein DSL92_01765 [Halomonas gudaonensis]